MLGVMILPDDPHTLFARYFVVSIAEDTRPAYITLKVRYSRKRGGMYRKAFTLNADEVMQLAKHLNAWAEEAKRIQGAM